MTQWEYTHAFVSEADAVAAETDYLKMLNRLGSQGWELVAQETHHYPWGGVTMSGTLKRPIADEGR